MRFCDLGVRQWSKWVGSPILCRMHIISVPELDAGQVKNVKIGRRPCIEHYNLKPWATGYVASGGNPWSTMKSETSKCVCFMWIDWWVDGMMLDV